MSHDSTSLQRRGSFQSSPMFAVGLALVCCLALWMRVSRTGHVLFEEEVLPLAPDVAYHLHRTVSTALDYPHVPLRDDFLNWPQGGAIPWPPGFDLLAATFAKLLGGATRFEVAERAAFLPVLLGLAVVVLVVLLARHLLASHTIPEPHPHPPSDHPLRTGLDPFKLETTKFQRGCPGYERIALAAGLLIALLPQAIATSAVGRLDHHVAEALIMALLGGWMLWGVRLVDDPRCTRGARVRFEAFGAAVTLWGCYTFAGTVLYVAIAAAALIWLSVTSSRSRVAGRWYALGVGAPALAVAGVLLVPLYAPAIAVHGRLYAYNFPSLLQPLLLGVAALGCSVASLIRARLGEVSAIRGRPSIRMLVISGGLLIGLGVSLALLPSPLRATLTSASDWLTVRDPWLATITEFRPMFREPLWRAGAWGPALEYYGLLGVTAPLVIPLGLARLLRWQPRTGQVFAIWTLALLLLTLTQIRFGRVFVVNLAILTAVALEWVLSLLFARLRGGVVATAALLVASLLLSLNAYTVEVVRWGGTREPSPFETTNLALRDLADPTPSERGAVLTTWVEGHPAIWLARRPVVAAGFGPWIDPAAHREVMEYPFSTAAQLDALMRRRELTFLIAGSGTLQPLARRFAAGPVFVPDAQGRGRLSPGFMRAVALSPLLIGGSGVVAAGRPHLPHLRPRFACPQTVSNLAIALPGLWIYERVAGARIVGCARPGDRVVAALGLRTPNAELPYTAWAQTGSDGHFELVLPLPSGVDSPGLRTDPAYWLTVGDGERAPLVVGERDVREGRRIDVDCGQNAAVAGPGTLAGTK